MSTPTFANIKIGLRGGYTWEAGRVGYVPAAYGWAFTKWGAKRAAVRAERAIKANDAAGAKR